MDNAKLIAELTKPAYNGLSAVQCAAKLNTDTAQITAGPTPSYVVRQAIQAVDLLALTQLQLLQLDAVISVDVLDPDDQNTVDKLAGIFSGKAATLNALSALRKKTVSVATSIDCGSQDNATLAQFITKITGRA